MSILQELDHFRIPFKEIKRATNNCGHENVIGRGGYMMVYKGKLLQKGKGMVTIAAKQVDLRYGHGENEFLNELRVLSSYQHENIVSFIGFCDEHDEKILVQEFVTYGSLDIYLSSAKLTWLKRLQICLGAARGLNYLHNGLKDHSSVIHRDVRSRTILLHNNWQAKIGGFGLSMMGPVDRGFIGTVGYLDPNYIRTGNVTKMSDVYPLGVVLFEVLCGMLESETYEDYKQHLGPFAHLHYEEGKLNEIIDPILREQMNPDSLAAFLAIAYQCLETVPSQRPTTIQIVQKLEQVLGLQQEFEKALALQQVKNLEHMKIPLEQIKLATHDFHDDFIIGRDGYGKVYKADLFHFDVQKYVTENIFQQRSMDELLEHSWCN